MVDEQMNRLGLGRFISMTLMLGGLLTVSACTTTTDKQQDAVMGTIHVCSSCHGTTDAKLGTPWLDGQSAVYIKTQLQAFASETRRNDISGQMRNIARQMTAAEIEEAAQYYTARP